MHCCPQFNSLQCNFLLLRLTQKALELPFLIVQFSGQTAKSFLVKVLTLVINETFEQDLTHSLDTLKNIAVKVVPKLLFAMRIAHDSAYSQ